MTKESEAETKAKKQIKCAEHEFQGRNEEYFFFLL